jgi:hypothetical protein
MVHYFPLSLLNSVAGAVVEPADGPMPVKNQRPNPYCVAGDGRRHETRRAKSGSDLPTSGQQNANFDHFIRKYAPNPLQGCSESVRDRRRGALFRAVL